MKTTLAHNARQNIGHYQFHPATQTATISGNAGTVDVLKSLAEALGWKVIVIEPSQKQPDKK